MDSIRSQATSGLKWTAISQFSRLGTQLLSMLILVRLLPPDDFGLIAIAAVITGFVGLLRDFGAAASIIQKPDQSPQFLDSIFWLNLAFGTGLAVLLGLCTPLIAIAFSEPRLKEVLWALILIFPIASLGAIHQALLEKVSRFRPLAIIESIAALAGLVAAVWAASAGWGVFSLVLQTLLVNIVTTFSLWSVSRWRPTLHWDVSELLSVMGFSGNLVGFNVINYFIRNADNLLIGRFLGATELGYYSMAYRIMLWPLQNVSSVVGRALFPVFSRLQEDTGRLTVAYVGTTAAVALVTAPLTLGFLVLRDPFIAVALGPRWQPVAVVLAWLVPVGLLQSVGTTVGTLYLATGRTDVMFKWSIAAGLLVLPAFAVGLQWGIVGVAAAYAVASLLLFYPGLAIPFRLVNLRVADVLLKILPSLLTAVAMAVVVAISAALWPENLYNPMLRLAILVALGIVTYAGLSLLTQRPLLKEMLRSISLS